MKSRSHRSQLPRFALLGGVALLFIGLSYVTAAHFGLLGFTDPDAGKTAVYVSNAQVGAYTRITRDHLKVIRLPTAPPAAITNVSKIVGRVLAKDKGAEYAFTEADFLPEGTQPGIVAGIPPNKRAFTVDTDKIAGLFGLQRGDSFDITAMFKAGGAGSTLLALPSSNAPATSGKDFIVPQLVVENGQIIIPLRTKLVPITDRSLTQGTRTKEKPVRETIIAVTPEEVQLLSQALSSGVDLFVSPRSGAPASAADARAQLASSEPSRKSSLRLVETLKGNSRQRLVVPND